MSSEVFGMHLLFHLSPLKGVFVLERTVLHSIVPLGCNYVDIKWKNNSHTPIL